MLKGMSKLNIKNNNCSKILELLKQQGPSVRTEIARKLSLTTASISMLTGEMREAGIILEVCENESKNKPGKNGMLLDINYDYGITLGCHVGDNRVYTGIANLKGVIQNRLETDLINPTDAQCVITAVIGSIASALKTCKKAPIGIGISINNELIHTNSMGSALLEAVKCRVEEEFAPLHAVVDIASRMLALAEIDFGTSPAAKNMVYLQVANSLDLAMVVNGELYCGAHGLMGWLDHVIIDPDGELCECGKRGCVKTVMTVSGLLNRVRQVYSKENTPVLYALTNGDSAKLEYDHIKIAAQRGDAVSAQIYDRDDTMFSALLFNFVTMIDPERCVIQGIGIYADEFIKKINTKVKETLGEKYKDIYCLSIINEHNIFLGGNAAAGRRFFYRADSIA